MIIKAEYKVNQNATEEHYAGGLLQMVEHLLKEWTTEKIIKDTYD